MASTPIILRSGVAVAILAACIGCDQATKRLAQEQLRGRPAQELLGGMLRLEYTENPGAFLGLGGEMSKWARWVLLTVVNGCIAGVLGVVLILRWSKHPARLLACALLLSGAIGNLIDRVRFDGLVIDFLNLGIGPLRTGIFNVADMAITFGAVLIMAFSFFDAPTRPAADVAVK